MKCKNYKFYCHKCDKEVLETQMGKKCPYCKEWLYHHLSKNHSPSEVADGKSLNAASGGDILRDKETELLLIKGFKSKPNHSPLTNPAHDSVSRIDGDDSPEETFSNEKETSGTLSSKKLFHYDRNAKYCLGDFCYFEESDIKDFIQKLKEEFSYMPNTRIHYGEQIIEKIDKLAGASLT